MRYNTSADNADSAFDGAAGLDDAEGGVTDCALAFSQVPASAPSAISSAWRQWENRFAEDMLQVAFCVARRVAGVTQILGYIWHCNKRRPSPQDARTSRGRNDATRSCTSRRAAESDGRQAIRPAVAVGGSAGSPEVSCRPNRRSHRQA